MRKKIPTEAFYRAGGLQKSPVSGLEKLRGTYTRRQSRNFARCSQPLFGKPFRDQVYPTRAKSMQTLRQKER